MSRKSNEAARWAVLAVPHGGLSEGLRGLLETLFDSVVQVGDERSLIACIEPLEPALLVLDLGFVRGGALELTRRLKRERPALRIVVLVDDEDPATARAVAAAGADGCLLRRALGVDLPRAVQQVLGGGSAFWSLPGEAVKRANTPPTG